MPSDYNAIRSKIIDLIISNYQPAKPSSKAQTSVAAESKAPQFIRNFRMRPTELIDFLSSRVIKQEAAIRILATKICGHYNHLRQSLEGGHDPMDQADRIKSNIMLIGPTGVGKTFLIRLLAKKIGVPFIKVDATKFTMAGYVGGDVEDIIRDLANKTKNAEGRVDVGMAQYGIVFIDECDKIASQNQTQSLDVSHRGVQQALLTIIEEAEVTLKQKMEIDAFIKIMPTPQNSQQPPKNDVVNTRNILFIFSGAFPGLKSIITKRANTRSIGFGAGLKNDVSQDSLNCVRTEDLINFGFEPEFIGRIPIKAVLEDLEEDDLFAILKHPQSPIVTKFKEEMSAYDLIVDLDDEVLRMVAAIAIKEKTGARGLVSAFNELLGEYETYLPDIEVPAGSVLPIRFTKQMVDGSIEPQAFVRELKQAFCDKLHQLCIEKQMESIKKYSDDILSRYGVRIIFTEGMKQALIDLSQKHGVECETICQGAFRKYENAFAIMRNRGRYELKISEDALQDPFEYLNRMTIEIQ